MLESEFQGNTAPLKVGLCVDGFTMRKVNEYYRSANPECSGINFLGLKHWVAVQASRYFWPGHPIEMMAHYYHPYRNPEAAQNRQRHVLRRLRDLGWISDAQYDEAINQKLEY